MGELVGGRWKRKNDVGKFRWVDVEVGRWIDCYGGFVDKGADVVGWFNYDNKIYG